ncbi:MAG: hypothetical protein ACRD20_14725 [Terriglobales bacterium]
MKKLPMAMLALVMMTGCSSEPPKQMPAEKPQPKPAEFVTGRVAFQQLYIAARGWARDAQPYRLESMTTDDSKGKEGKSGIWRASFASPMQHGVKAYTWSGEIASDRGINPGTEDTYNPTNTSTQIFDVAFLKVDSDKALETAQKHGGEKLLAKSPDTPIVYMLDWSKATNQLIWHVIYGISRDDYKLTVAVNASSGDFIRVEK